jgi:methyl-accepting chemotaxis protein
MIEAIAASSNEQSVGIAQVHKAIADIDAVTQQNAALVEETTAAAESLNHEANELRQNMAFFKTGQGGQLPIATRAATNRATSKLSKPATKALAAPSKAEQATEWQEF